MLLWHPGVIKCHHLVLYNIRMRWEGIRGRAWGSLTADTCTRARGFLCLVLVEFYTPDVD